MGGGSGAVSSTPHHTAKGSKIKGKRTERRTPLIGGVGGYPSAELSDSSINLGL